MNFFEDNFSFEEVVSKWEAFLIQNKTKEYKLQNSSYRMKWLKELKRQIGKKYPLVYKLPTVERILLFIERMLHGRITYIDS